MSRDRQFDLSPDDDDSDSWGPSASAGESAQQGSHGQYQGGGHYNQGGGHYQDPGYQHPGYQPHDPRYQQQAQPAHYPAHTRDPDQEPARPQRRRKKRHPVRKTIVTLLVILLVILGALVAYAAVLAHKFNESQAIPVAEAFPTGDRPEHPSGDKSVNFLLLGNDSRGDEDDGGRTDTMMLMHIPSDRKGVYVTSIMRDTWVDIPGHGQAKINAAYAQGKMPLTVQTLEKELNVPIDHVMTIDFSGFEGMVDALNGVSIKVPEPFDKAGTHYEGTMDVDGKEALWFVRERYAFKDGDYQRVKNQQQLVQVVFSKLLSPRTLLDPMKTTNTVGAMAPFLTRDETLGGWDLVKLAATMPGVRSSDFHFMTLPNKGVGTSPDGQSIVVPDNDAIAAYSKALREGGMEDFMNRYDLEK